MKRLWTLLLCCLSLCCWAQQTLVVGKVSEDLQKTTKALKPLADYLASGLTDEGFSPVGEVVVAKDNAQMIDLLKRGKVHVVSETVGSTVLYALGAETLPVLLAMRNGTASYRSVIFVRHDSPVRNLDGLRGKTIAFQDEGSTSAYFLPAAVLIRQGLHLRKLDSPQSPAPGGSVGFAFAGSELNIVTWVSKGTTNAGAVSDVDWENPEKVPAALRKDLRIVHTSESWPRAMLSVGAKMSESTTGRIKHLLLSAPTLPGGPAMLKATSTAGYATLNREDGIAMEQIRRLMQKVRAER